MRGGGSAAREPLLELPTPLLIQEIDHAFVRRERHNFAPAGHYARPDVLRLELDRARRGTLSERG